MSRVALGALCHFKAEEKTSEYKDAAEAEASQSAWSGELYIPAAPGPLLLSSSLRSPSPVYPAWCRSRTSVPLAVVCADVCWWCEYRYGLKKKLNESQEGALIFRVMSRNSRVEHFRQDGVWILQGVENSVWTKTWTKQESTVHKDLRPLWICLVT